MNYETAELKKIADGFHFAESPRWRHGHLYFSDLFGLKVFVIDPSGIAQVVCSVPHMPSGLGFAPDGSLLIVSMADRKLLRFSENKLTEAADLSQLMPYHCNDMLVDDQGRAYVGNFGWHSGEPNMRLTNLILVMPNGESREVGGGINFPNGIARTPDGHTLIVSESFASRLSAFDIEADGSLGKHRVWARLNNKTFTTVVEAIASKDPLPDGIALDAEGALWVADSGGNAALRIAEGGKILETIPTGDLTVYGLTLGGDDRCTLFMCAAPPIGKVDLKTEKKSVIFSRRVGVPGVGLP